LVHEEAIHTGLQAGSAEEAIRTLAGKLAGIERVEAAFADDVWARERVHPTGLPTEPVAVAIPHADPIHVLQSAVAIGVLDRSVSFGLIGGVNGATVPVQVVFLLAIKETEKQVVMIQELMSLLQTPRLLTRVAQAASPLEVRRVFSPDGACAVGEMDP
jgi:PTS system galactitol-specific IIA component